LRKYDGKPRQLSLTVETIATLVKIPSLESLDLSEIRLTSADLAPLSALPNLKKLNLREVDISADDVEQLRTTMPGVTIEWKPMTDEERAKLDEFLK
jgi:Leucine-rich repeat (LRR) protein